MAASIRNLGKTLVTSKLLQVATKTIATLNNKDCIRFRSSSGSTKFTPEIESGWPDDLLGPVTPAHQKFPLPGNF